MRRGGAGAVRRARRPVRRRGAGPRPVDGRPAAHRDRQGAVGRCARPDPRRADRVAVRPRGRAPVRDRPPPARPRRRRSCSSAIGWTRSSTCATARRSCATARHVVTHGDQRPDDRRPHPAHGRPRGDAVPEGRDADRRRPARGRGPDARRRVRGRQLRRPRRRDRRDGRARRRRPDRGRPRPVRDRPARRRRDPARRHRPVDFDEPVRGDGRRDRLPPRGPPPGGPRPRLLDRRERDPADPAAAVPPAARPARPTERDVARELHRAVPRADDRRRPAGRRAVRRQPAEGRARQVAGDRSRAS